MHQITFRKATSNDKDKIWEIIQHVISTGDTFVFDPQSSKDKMLAYWCGADKHIYVAECNGSVAGTFIIKDNQPDLGAHIANASYMIAKDFRGYGIGKMMGEYSLQEAKKLGYKAMQFNYVVKSNAKAVALWQSLGFEIIGEVPEAFSHKTEGLTSVYVMYKKL